MTMTEFAGTTAFDLAIGEVFGIRAWKIDKHGRLRALHVNGANAWRPGVNVAECRRSDDPFGAIYASIQYHSISLTTGSVKPEKPKEPEKPQPHDIPVEGCRCGFYAYTDVKHEENKADAENRYILGVIKGTGRTLIGSRGFRCEKAEIVALLDPTRGGWLLHDWRRKQRNALRRVYPDVPLMASRRALLAVAPVESTIPDPTMDEFWSMP